MRTLYFPCGYYLPLNFSSPNLSRRRLDICHTSTHGIALVRIYDAGLTQKLAKKSPSGHHSTTLSGYIFAIKARIDNRKKDLLNGNTSPTCLYNMVIISPLAAEIGSLVWVPQLISTGFASWQRYCTAIQYWASSKPIAALNRGCHLYSAGRTSHWHWPTF